MFLQRVTVQGLRAAAETPITVEFPGRFSVLVGSNGAGKTTINDAVYLAHPVRFPRLSPPDASVLGPAPRSVDVVYAYEPPGLQEGAFGQSLRAGGGSAPSWTRSLERSLGQVRARDITSLNPGHDEIRLIYLPAVRNPVDQLSRRETQVLIELLRAEQLRNPATGTLIGVRQQAEAVLSSLTGHQLVVDVQARIADNLRLLTSGVREHFAFIGTQRVDDAYLARVLELVLATIPDPAQARRLEGASLGYVNLLHIAVTLAGIPDPSSVPTTPTASGGAGDDQSDGDVVPPEGDEGPDAARARLREADQLAEEQQDSFFPPLFHATVLIEEPEAHLHPQLQHGLVRYLRQATAQRPDLQVIVSTHASEILAACPPDEMVVVRRDRTEGVVTRTVAQISWSDAQRGKITRMAKLHLDASRSGALFAEQVVLVEGITEAALLRAFGRAWAGGDDAKLAFIDALSIVPLGNRVGEWPVRLLAHPGEEIASRVAVLSDTDLRGDPLPDPAPPSWHATFTDADRVRFFWSQPTLEPTLVPGNETLVRIALTRVRRSVDGETPTSGNVDDLFQDPAGRGAKGEFAFELAAAVDDDPGSAQVPAQLQELYEWLWEGHQLASRGSDTKTTLPGAADPLAATDPPSPAEPVTPTAPGI